MRINSDGISSGVGSVSSKRGPVPAASTSRNQATSESNDVFSVSSDAQQVAVLRDKIAKMPLVRGSKVEAVQNQIVANSYNPDSKAVADGLLKEHSYHSSYKL